MSRQKNMDSLVIDDDILKLQTNAFTYNDSSSDEEYIDRDEDIEEYMDSLRYANRIKPKRKKNETSKQKQKRRREFMRNARSKKNDPEIITVASQANDAFIREDFDRAIELYKELARLDPEDGSSYNTLGEIFYSKGKYEEALIYWQVGAQVIGSDPWRWGHVAEMSLKLGRITHAIRTYGKAIACFDDDATDEELEQKMSYIIERANLYKSTGQLGRALDGFRRAREYDPQNPDYVKELASLYVESRRENDAINLYMDIFTENLHPKAVDAQGNPAHVPIFDWASLNIITELYISKRLWVQALKTIKAASRYFQNRQDEKWWDDYDLDVEFDSRRVEIMQKVKAPQEAYLKEYELPIDIRYKLGILRLELEQVEEAMIHFNYLLLEEEEEEIADLFLGAGKALESKNHFSEALTFLTHATKYDAHSDLDSIALLASCYFEVGDYADAKDAYSALLEAAPDEMDIKLSLAEVLYRLDEVEEAQKLLAEVSAASKKIKKAEHERQGTLKDQPSETEAEIEENNLFLSNRPVKRSRGQKPTEAEKITMEETAKRKVMETYRHMETLQKDIEKGHSVAIDTWILFASRLIEVFASVPNFFPKDKNRSFKGFILYRRKNDISVNEKILRVNTLYNMMSLENTSRQVLASEKEFRGLDYGKWFMIFVQYALFQIHFKNDLEYATSIIEVAQEVSVFVQDKDREAILRLVRLIIGIHSEKHMLVVMGYVRYFLVANQFSPFIYKLFVCCFSSGVSAWAAFSNYNHQKFFLRQLKAHDSLYSGKKITGMATVTADVQGVSLKEEPCELLYIYSNLLGGNRNYISPIVYLNRAYKLYNKDPMICLTLGLAHVHRSMQRLSTNRHIQLLQGISYVMEYRDLRLQNATTYEKQEVEFNVGRLFHMIGLRQEAVVHYNKALEYHDELSEDPDFDLLVEAAYSLALIYNINGNSLLARELTEKYLTI